MTPAVQRIADALAERGYVADAPVATALHLAQELARPLLVEGPAGVGKTEIAKALSEQRGTELIRLQCFEGIDAAAALYEWNYGRQLLEIRRAESAPGGAPVEIFGREFLLERPLLRALTAAAPPVLLIDEVDRADEAFEAFLLELLSEWQVTIPELGPVRAAAPPLTVLTSNRTRELSDALRRRCLYLWIDYPPFAKELAIVRRRLPGADAALAARIVAFVQLLRDLPLEKTPGVAETLDWCASLSLLHADELSDEVVLETVAALLKHVDDQTRLRDRWLGPLLEALRNLERGREALWLEQARQRVGAALR